MTRSLTILGALALCAVVLAGCSDDGDDRADADRPTTEATAATEDNATTEDSATTEANATTPAATTPEGVELSGPVNDEGSADISGDGAEPSIDVEVDDSYFEPTFIKAAPGASVTVHLENEGEATHTFTVDGGVDQRLEPGDDATVTVEVPDSGSLRFSCDFHSGMGMQGAFSTA